MLCVSGEHGIGWVWQGYTGVWSLVRVSFWWKLTLNIQWTYSERNIEHTLNTVQKAANSSKSVQLIVIFRKKHKHWIFFRFPPIRSFPQFSQCSMPRSLHVQCTFNVRSLSAHCERVVPVVKSMRSVKEGVGSVTGCILNSAFAALSLQLLQREHFAQGTSRKSISFCFRPRRPHSHHNTPTHCTRPCFTHLRKGISVQGIGQVSPECEGMLCVWRAWDRLGLTGLHRCMVSCKGKFLVEADIEHTVNIQWTQHWTHIEHSPKSCK